MQLGNGRWETASYNNRLQITQIGLGTTDVDQNQLKLELSYGTPTQNNGSLREQKITVPTVGQTSDFTAIQTYIYDDLNRIQSATETISGNQTWKQTFVIDRYGNRRFDAANTTTLGGCSQAQCNSLINTSDNRFTTSQGYSYDQNGNVTQDARGQRFTYDAENHQKEFFAIGNGSSNPDATYHYDGEGKRVKKITATETTVFVYDASGQLAAEYSTTVVQAIDAKVSYLTTDHLGSPRVITDQNGAVTSRKDFAAFGDEIVSSQRVGGPTGNGYNPPNVRQDYTGYQKDDESGLEFAQARYYSSQTGRFTSVDPLTASASIRNPQTFNRYSYVLNSPYKFVDPLGLLSSSTGACGQWCPNSDGGGGGYSGRDASFDWMREWTGEVVGYQVGSGPVQLNGRDFTVSRGGWVRSMTSDPPPGANVTRNPDKFYEVEGGTAYVAMNNADASKANSDCQAGYAGCTAVTMTKSLGTPATSKAVKVKGGYEVTENLFEGTINVVITVYLPRWKGYDAASQGEKDAWGASIGKLKDHEEGHVDIATQEANNTARAVNAALPSSRTFISRTGTKAGITAAVTRRYQAANKAAYDGYNRRLSRSRNYDNLTQHGRIPRFEVKY